MLADPITKNPVLDTILARARELQPAEHGKPRYHLPQLDVIHIIYSGTLPGSHARRLLVELYDAQCITLTSIREWDGVPQDFMDELSKLKRATRAKKKGEEPRIELSRYHELDSEAETG
jgi:hypothetical protein